MKKIIVSAISMLVLLGCIFLIGCSRKEENPQPTQQVTQKLTQNNTETQEETESTELAKDFYQMYIESIANIDIEEVKKVAYDYYFNELTFIKEVVDIRICKEEWLTPFMGEDAVLGEFVVFEVDTITYGMEDIGTDYRFMTLQKDNTGKWKVTNEGR